MSLFDLIGEIDIEDINDALDAIIARKRELYPDWEILYAAIPKTDPQQRTKAILYNRGIAERTVR